MAYQLRNSIANRFNFISIAGSPAWPKPDNAIEGIQGGNGYTVEFTGYRADPFVLDCVAYYKTAIEASREYLNMTGYENSFVYYRDQHGVEHGPFMVKDVIEVNDESVGANSEGDYSGVRTHTRWTMQYMY